MIEYPKPPFPKQKQAMPGLTSKMEPAPDHGEQSYKGSGRLSVKRRSLRGATAASAARSRLHSRAKAPIC